MPRRATKPKPKKKAAPKTRRKSKPSQPKADAAAEETKQSEITQTMPIAVEAPLEAAEPAPETLVVEPKESKADMPPEEKPPAQAEIAREPAPVVAVAEMMMAPPAPQPLATPPLELSADEAQEQELGESSLAEELPPRQNVPPNHMFIGKKPVMGYALSAVMQLTQYEEVVLRARGKAISRAVDVAEVIKHRLGNGRFVARYIKIDTDVVGEGAEKRNVSTIEIGVGKRA
jgi:DNA-binding protein